jgi:hypothetical protein
MISIECRAESSNLLTVSVAGTCDSEGDNTSPLALARVLIVTTGGVEAGSRKARVAA